MSFHRENIIWESALGDWRMGFYAVSWVGEDPEWDVVYDYDRFMWVGPICTGPDQAMRSHPFANPGAISVNYDPSAVSDLNAMAARYFTSAAI